MKSDFFRLQANTPLEPLTMIGLENKPTQNDGDCGFAAVVASLGGEHTIQSLRHITANHMRTYRDEYTAFYLSSVVDPCTDEEEIPYEKYCDYIEEGSSVYGDQAWADHIPLKALASALHINLIIIDTEAILIVKCEEDKDRQKQPLFILFDSEHKHYQSISVLPGYQPYVILDDMSSHEQGRISACTNS